MKKLLLSVLCMCAAVLSAQNSNSFTLKGTIKNTESGKVYLNIMDTKASQLDSAIVKNGSFTITGKVSGICRAILVLAYPNEDRRAASRANRADMIYIEPNAVIQLQADEGLKNCKAVSPVNDEFQLYQKAITFSDMNKFMDRYRALTPEQQKDTVLMKEYQREYEEILQKRHEMQMQYIKSHPDSYFSVEALGDLASSQEELRKLEPVFNKLSKKLRDSGAGKAFAQRLEAARATAIGHEAPLFTQNDPDGKPVKLTDFRGKYVLIDFWASWCVPCRKENPNVVKAYNAFKDKGFTILGVSLDNPGAKDKWLEAIKKDNLTWTHVSDLKGWDNEVSNLYDIRSIPANFLVDPKGKIIAHNLRGDQLEKFLEGIFNK